MKLNDSGTISFEDNGNTHHIVFTHLSIFDWILVYDLDETTILTKDLTVASLKNNIIILFSTIGVISITGFYFGAGVYGLHTVPGPEWTKSGVAHGGCLTNFKHLYCVEQ